MLASSHSHSRSGSPRVQSPLLPAEAIVRLGPERPRGPTAVLIDGRPAQEAEEEAGAQQHLDEGRGGAVRRPGSVLRDEQGVEVLALPETVTEEDAAEVRAWGQVQGAECVLKASNNADCVSQALPVVQDPKVECTLRMSIINVLQV